MTVTVATVIWLNVSSVHAWFLMASGSSNHAPARRRLAGVPQLAGHFEFVENLVANAGGDHFALADLPAMPATRNPCKAVGMTMAINNIAASTSASVKAGHRRLAAAGLSGLNVIFHVA